MLRNLSVAAMLAGAAGVPYFIWNSDQLSEWTNFFSAESAEVEATDLPAEQKHTVAPATNVSAKANYNPTSLSSNANKRFVQPKGTATAPLLLTGKYNNSLTEVLRMDVSPAWVNGRWTRVTTTLADSSYDGRRVPYISGTQEGDVSGSLTYYFDKRQIVQRITFHGTTGNPQPIIAYLINTLEFKKRDGLNGELYSRKWLGQTTSLCQIRPAAVIQAGDGISRYEVLLELNRSTWKSNLSEAAQRLVAK